jgi:hypothetical protein
MEKKRRGRPRKRKRPTNAVSVSNFTESDDKRSEESTKKKWEAKALEKQIQPKD